MQEFEKITPGEIKDRLAAGREVRLWDHDGGHSKITGVITTGNVSLGIDSTNTTIFFDGPISGRPCSMRVNDHARIKVMKEDGS